MAVGDPTLDRLAARGAAAAGDLIPTLPLGGATLLAQSAGALQAFVLNQVGQFGAVDPTGVADSTGAFQAAIASGQSFDIPPGVFRISANLAMTAAVNHGQRIRGAGPVANDGNGTGRTVLRPTAAVTTLFTIDGTSFAKYLQGWSFEDFTVDMAAMADVATSAAFNQVQAYDGRYRNIKVVGDGANKRCWLFNAGAYTTLLDTCAGNFVEATGISDGNGVTTITFLNFDGGSCQWTYAVNMKVIGGAFQKTGGTRFRIRHGCSFQLECDIEGAGVFLDVDSTVNALWSRCELQGWAGTYMVGAPAPSAMLWDQQVNYNSYPFNMTVGRFDLNNQGVATYSSFLSGGATKSYYVQIGRTDHDLMLAASAAANDFVSGCAAGDAIIGAWGLTNTTFIVGGQYVAAKATPTGFSTFGTGTLTQGTVLVQPAADGDVFTIRNAAGTVVLDFNTQAAAASSLLELAFGAGQVGYTDNFATQSWKIVGASGQISAGSQLYAGGGTAAAPVLTTACGFLQGNGNPANTLGNNGDLYFRGDGTHGASNLIWHKEAGAWVNIL